MVDLGGGSGLLALIIVISNKEGIEQHRKKSMSGTKIIIRPWSDFLSTSDVSVPKRADVLSERIRLNLNHWLGNYLCIVAAFVVMAGYLQAPFSSSFMFPPF